MGEWGGGWESHWPCGMDGMGAGLWNQEIICLGNTLDYSLCLQLALSKWSKTFADLSFQSERADGGPGSLSTTHLSALWTIRSFQRAVFGSQNVLGMIVFGSRNVPRTELLKLFLVNRKSMESDCKVPWWLKQYCTLCSDFNSQLYLFPDSESHEDCQDSMLVLFNYYILYTINWKINLYC